LPHLLLVDDEAALLSTQAEVLERHGFTVTTAHTGDAAIRAVEADPNIRLVLMDIDLGLGMDGVEAARRILEIRALPIVFLTEHGDKETVDRAHTVPRYGYVLKSAGASLLVETITTAFELFAAQERGRQAEEKLEFDSLVLDQLHDRVTVTDLDGYITYVNQAEVDTFGIPKEQLVGRHVSYFGEDPDHGATQEEILRQTLSKGSWEGEVVNITASGRRVVFESRVQLVHDPEGTPIGLCGVSTDVTERVEREQELRKARADIETTLNSVGDAVIATDTDGTVTRMNPKAEELTGWTLNRARGRQLRDVFHIVNAITRERAPNPVEAVLATGVVQGLANHTKLIAASGVEYHIADSAAPILTPAGDLRGVVLVFRDVTDEYTVRERLRKREAHLSAAQALARLGSYEFDFDAGRVTASPEAHAIYGTPGNPLSVGEAQTIPLPEYRPVLDAALRELIRGEGPYDLEFRIRRANDGAVRDIHSVAEYDAETNTLLGTIQDITERKEKERRIVSLLADKDRLIKEVHHRTKNNLSTISSLLSLQASQSSVDAVAEALNDAKARVNAMQGIYGKLYNSDSYEEIDLAASLESLAADLVYAGSIGDSRVRLTTDLESVIVPTDVSIPVGLIVNELVTNALKYAFPNHTEGTIGISLHRVDDGSIEIVVEDDGVGFDENIDRGPSHGFGLQLVRAEVQQLDGELEIHSGPPTRFVVRIPEQPAPSGNG
jgi:PAS domain S-box-containing protein